MTLFRGIDYENLKDGEYIQFFGIHMLSWGDIERATGIKPTIAFIEDDTLEKQNANLIKGLERAEQTIRNLGNGELTGDGKQIALNEAANLRDDIAKTKAE